MSVFVAIGKASSNHFCFVVVACIVYFESAAVHRLMTPLLALSLRLSSLALILLLLPTELLLVPLHFLLVSLSPVYQLSVVLISFVVINHFHSRVDWWVVVLSSVRLETEHLMLVLVWLWSHVLPRLFLAVHLVETFIWAVWKVWLVMLLDYLLRLLQIGTIHSLFVWVWLLTTLGALHLLDATFELPGFAFLDRGRTELIVGMHVWHNTRVASKLTEAAGV